MNSDTPNFRPKGVPASVDMMAPAESWYVQNGEGEHGTVVSFASPEEQLRNQFVDGILPEVGDKIELVVSEVDMENFRIHVKYRTVKQEK